MSTRKPRRASAASAKQTVAAPLRRRHRPRPTPTWLTHRKDLDEVARRRCLLVLSVLSGEKPVTDAIEEAGISRGMYYQMEERALYAMLEALVPGAGAPSAPGAEGAIRRVQELEARNTKLEQEKRRSERLLLLTRKVMKPGPVKTAMGRPRGPRKRPSSTTPGGGPSAGSRPTTSTASTPTAGALERSASTSPMPAPNVAASSPTKDGAVGR